ncbi:MAG: glycosyltransferase, partial [Spirochaetes bacterium]|nr:glycosyltransferase [Spirochaetota bacterium]
MKKIPVVVYIRGTDIRYSHKNFFIRTLTRFTLKNVDLIFSMGPNLTEMIKKHGDFKVIDIHNPFDINITKKKYKSDYLKKEFKINPLDKILVSNGRLVSFRDPFILIRAMKILKEKVKNIKLFIIGEGYLNEKCHALIKKLGLQEHVIMTGKRDDVFSFNSLADLYISMCCIENIWTNSLIEAMAFQLPVIAFNVGYTSRILHHKEHLYLVPYKNNDPKLLADAIITMFKNKFLRKKLSQNSYNYIKNNN